MSVWSRIRGKPPFSPSQLFISQQPPKNIDLSGDGWLFRVRVLRSATQKRNSLGLYGPRFLKMFIFKFYVIARCVGEVAHLFFGERPHLFGWSAYIQKSTGECFSRRH
jgi:hypothetical protein